MEEELIFPSDRPEGQQPPRVIPQRSTSKRSLETTDIPAEEEPDEEEPHTAKDTFFDTPFSMANDIKEVKIRTPSEFKGDKDKATKFIREIELYLHINEHIYDTDEKRIAFALSFMTDGAAAAWKEAYIADKTVRTGGFSFSTWEDFLRVFKEGFAPIDEAGNARLKLKTLKQGERTAEEYISDFRIYALKSGITADEALSEYFMDGLQPRLLEKIFTMEKLPVKISDWFVAASKYNLQWCHAKAITGRIRKETPIHTYDQVTSVKAGPFIRGPDAMDVDGLTREQRKDHFKRGLCFECHLPGHTVESHKKTGTFKTNAFQHYKKPYKPSGKSAYSKIRATLANLDDEGKEEALKMIEEQGF